MKYRVHYTCGDPRCCNDYLVGDFNDEFETIEEALAAVGTFLGRSPRDSWSWALCKSDDSWQQIRPRRNNDGTWTAILHEDGHIE